MNHTDRIQRVSQIRSHITPVYEIVHVHVCWLLECLDCAWIPARRETLLDHHLGTVYMPIAQRAEIHIPYAALCFHQDQPLKHYYQAMIAQTNCSVMIGRELPTKHWQHRLVVVALEHIHVAQQVLHLANYTKLFS